MSKQYIRITKKWIAVQIQIEVSLSQITQHVLSNFFVLGRPCAASPSFISTYRKRGSFAWSYFLCIQLWPFPLKNASRFKRSISFGSQFLYNLPLLFNGRIFLYLVALLLLPCNRISMCWLLAYLRCTSCIKTINLHGDLRHLHIYLLIMAVDVFGSKIGNQNIVRNYINRIAQFNASIWMVRPNYPFHRTGCACEWMFFSWSTIVSHL